MRNHHAPSPKTGEHGNWKKRNKEGEISLKRRSHWTRKAPNKLNLGGSKVPRPKTGLESKNPGEEGAETSPVKKRMKKRARPPRLAKRHRLFLTPEIKTDWK